MRKTVKFDGFLICPGNSKKQMNQFKRFFIKDNLNQIPREQLHLYMRKISKKSTDYSLKVFIKNELIGYFYVEIIPLKLSVDIFKMINEQSEEMFQEESFYGIKDVDGLDRVNNSIYGGFGSYELYPTVTDKAAALWYKIATNQFFNNGNKRTAMLSALYLLAGSFYTFDVTDTNLMYNISLDAANKKIDIKYIEKFITEHVSLNYDNMAIVLETGQIDYSQALVFKNLDNILH